ncbi:MAG TPA: tRNA modification GTPase [Pirellulales bacterium]|nr:tRNA modification GTPase [Pirellulales bacterium]
MHHTDDTIAAIASATGGAPRGIIRISGPRALEIAQTCCAAAAPVEWSSLTAATVISCTVHLDGAREIALPVDLYVWPGRRSYTRQPMVELHTIGSPPLLSQVLKRVCLVGARLAEPGEFTLRAFLAGRIDLTQAEATLGIIDARDPGELQTALAQLAGGLARPLEQLRDELVNLLADIEAGLDFVEEDIQFVAPHEIEQRILAARHALAEFLAQISRRGSHEALPRAVLVGCENVGKSSLFNALVDDGRALVSDQPGTTRDYLTARLQLDGMCCQLIDTAGVAHANDAIAQRAQELTAERAQDSELCLLCIDASRPLGAWEQTMLATTASHRRLVVLTKCDRPSLVQLPCGAIATSALGAMGLEELCRAVSQALRSLDPPQEVVGLTAQRCDASVRLADESLARACQLNQAGSGEELIASELRRTLDELGKVAGTVYTDDVLDKVFSRFCIGK